MKIWKIFHVNWDIFFLTLYAFTSISFSMQFQICCTSIVYATDKKQTKVEFPEARIYEEAMNVLLFEEREVCTRCGGDERNCSSLRNLPAAQLQLPPFVYSSHSSSVSVCLIFLSIKFTSFNLLSGAHFSSLYVYNWSSCFPFSIMSLVLFVLSNDNFTWKFCQESF